LENDGSNKDAIDEIFRAAHTLKGGSATVEMMELSHFTHLVEDVLDAIRSDQLVVSGDVVDTLLSAIDVIKAMLEQRMNGSVYQEDTSQIEGRLHAFLPEGTKPRKAPAVSAPPAPKPAPAAAPAPKAAPSAPSSSGLTDEELQELKESVDDGLPILRISVKFDEKSLMNTVGGIQVYAALKGIGTVLRTVPEFESLYEDNFFPLVDYYVACSKSFDEIKKYVILPDVSLGADITDISKPQGSPTVRLESRGRNPFPQFKRRNQPWKSKR